MSQAAIVPTLPEDTTKAIGPAEVATLQKHLADLATIRGEVSALEVSTPEDLVRLGEWSGQIDAALREVKARHIELNRAPNDQLAKLKSVFGPVKDALEACKREIERKHLAFVTAERERERKEQAARDAEVLRLAEERRKQEAEAAERQKKADAMVSAGQVAGAILPQLAPPPPPPEPVRPAITGARTFGYGTLALKEEWKVEVADLVEVARHYPELLDLRIGDAKKRRPAVGDGVDEVVHNGLRFFRAESSKHKA